MSHYNRHPPHGCVCVVNVRISIRSKTTFVSGYGVHSVEVLYLLRVSLINLVQLVKTYMVHKVNVGSQVTSELEDSKLRP